MYACNSACDQVCVHVVATLSDEMVRSCDMWLDHVTWWLDHVTWWLDHVMWLCMCEQWQLDHVMWWLHHVIKLCMCEHERMNEPIQLQTQAQ